MWSLMISGNAISLLHSDDRQAVSCSFTSLSSELNTITEASSCSRKCVEYQASLWHPSLVWPPGSHRSSNGPYWAADHRLTLVSWNNKSATGSVRWRDPEKWGMVESVDVRERWLNWKEGKSPQHTGFLETWRLWGVLYKSLSFLTQALISLCHTDAILSYSFSVFFFFLKCLSMYVQIYNALGEYVSSTAYWNKLRLTG